MLRYLTTFTLGFLFTMASVASASDATPQRKKQWRTVVETPHLALGYDQQRIERQPRGIYTAWTRLQFAEPQMSGQGEDQVSYLYSIQREEFDCPRRRSRTVGRFLYDAEDREVGSDKKWREWEKVVPGSLGATLHENFCAEVGRRYGGQ